MNIRMGGIVAGSALVLACGAAAAQDLGKLGGMISAGGMVSAGSLGGLGGNMTSGSTGNVAGLLQFCVQNNYLGGDSGAAGVKDKLLGKLRGDSGYASGAKGILQSRNGSTLDLNSVGGGNGEYKSRITRRACDSALNQGRNLL